MNDLDYTGCPCTTCRRHYARGKRSYAYAIVVVVALAIFLLWAGYASGQATYQEVANVRVVSSTGVSSPYLCGDDPAHPGIFKNTADYPGCIDGSAFTPGLKVQNNQVWVPAANPTQSYEATCEYQWFYCNARPKPPINCVQMKAWMVLRIPDLGLLGQSDTLGGTITPIEKRSFVCPSLPPTTNTPGVIPSPTAVSISPSASPLPVLSPTLIPTATHSTLPCEGAMFGLPCPPGTVSVSTPTTVASSTRTPTAVATAYPSATAVPTTIPATPVSIPSPSPIRATPTIARATPVVLPLTPRPRITVSRTWFPTKSAPSATPTATTSTQGGQTSGGSPGTGSYLALGAILTGIIVKARGWIARQWAKLKSLVK